MMWSRISRFPWIALFCTVLLLIPSSESIAAECRDQSGNTRRRLSSWTDPKTKCSSVDFKFSIFVNSHVHLVALPPESDVNPACFPIVFHDAGQEGKEALEMLEGLNESWNDRLELGTFKIATLVDAFHATEDKEPGYDVVNNNCATVVLRMMKNLGIVADQEFIEYVARKLHENGTTAKTLRASPHVADILPKGLEVASLDDAELLELLVITYVDNVHPSTDSGEAYNAFSLPPSRHLQTVPPNAEYGIYVHVQKAPEGGGCGVNVIFMSESNSAHPNYAFLPCFQTDTSNIGNLEPISGLAVDEILLGGGVHVGSSSFGNILAATQGSSTEISGEYKIVANNCMVRVVEALRLLDISASSVRQYVLNECVEGGLADVLRTHPDELALLFNGVHEDPKAASDRFLVELIIDYVLQEFNTCGDGNVDPGEGCDLSDEGNSGTGECTNFCSSNAAWYCLPDSELSQFYFPRENNRYQCQFQVPDTHELDNSICPGGSCARYWCTVFGWGTFEEPDICNITPCPWADGYILLDPNLCTTQETAACGIQCATKKCVEGGGNFKSGLFWACEVHPCPHSPDRFQLDVDDSFADKFTVDENIKKDICYSRTDSASCDEHCAQVACNLNGGEWRGAISSHFVCLFPSKTLSCKQRAEKSYCENDPSCSWISNTGLCATKDIACSVLSESLALDICTPDGSAILTPGTEVFDVRMSGVDLADPALRIRDLRMDGQAGYLAFEYMPSYDEPEYVRVYTFIPGVLNPGLLTFLQVNFRSCSTPLYWPIQVQPAETSVEWFNSSSSPSIPDPIESWEDVSSFCSNNGMVMCSYHDICPYGPDRVSAGDPYGDSNIPAGLDLRVAFAPTADDGSDTDCSNNSWVQISCVRENVCTQCVIDNEICPGETVVLESAYQQFIACCHEEEESSGSGKGKGKGKGKGRGEGKGKGMGTK